MWGKRYATTRSASRARITPTRVGKTGGSQKTISTRHGSPPRVWGKPGVRRANQYRPRITPTRVGKTVANNHHARRHGDHPHACGENYSVIAFATTSGGSPPRVWGKLRACCMCRVGTWDHPHACGENRWRLPHKQLGPGSPPRVWGKPCRGRFVRLVRRITPTRVGKTAMARAISTCMKDHPHACGEN